MLFSVFFYIASYYVVERANLQCSNASLDAFSITFKYFSVLLSILVLQVSVPGHFFISFASFPTHHSLSVVVVVVIPLNLAWLVLTLPRVCVVLSVWR